MPRPKRCRCICGEPGATYFKPAGIPLRRLETVTLSLDEFEALRLADLEGWRQVRAAAAMGVSRPTFGRIVDEAHRKVARALAGGLALRIEGGTVSRIGLGPERVCGRARVQNETDPPGAPSVGDPA